MSNNKRLISCKTITYGRVSFLEESLYSFLNQEYDGKKELVIVNDYPLQELVFDHPDVKIFNLDKTFDPLGDKENFATSLCRGNIIAQWDDDDIALSNHLQNIEKYFVEGTDLLLWANAMFINMPNITSITGVGNSGLVYSKECWEKIGGYPLENAGYDMSFVMKIRTMEGVNFIQASPPREEVSWGYRWGGADYHCSGQGTDTPDRPSIIKRHAEHIEGRRRRDEIPIGKIHLTPRWKLPYDKLLKDFIDKS